MTDPTPFEDAVIARMSKPTDQWPGHVLDLIGEVVAAPCDAEQLVAEQERQNLASMMLIGDVVAGEDTNTDQPGWTAFVDRVRSQPT